VTIALVNPHVSIQKNDPHTGIVFWPFMLAYLASYLETLGHEVQVIDFFGLDPFHLESHGNRRIQGLKWEQLTKPFGHTPEHIFILARGVEVLPLLAEYSAAFRRAFPNTPITLLENNQAVTAFSLKHCAKTFSEAFDFLVMGEPELPVGALLNSINEGKPSNFPGIWTNAAGQWSFSELPLRWDYNLDKSPAPAWRLFPLEGYWKFPFSHGPKSNQRYLQVLGSRGCPYRCNFCTVPELTALKWRGKSGAKLAEEIEELRNLHDVHEFHFEDLNPLINKKRTREFCNELVKRNLSVSYKFVSGTKIETLPLEDIPLLAKSGCTYLSFSPESGSTDTMKLIGKPFDHEYAIKSLISMTHHGIHTQACFVFGIPGETLGSLIKSFRYVHRLVRNGLSEIAVFLIAPLPGSKLYEELDGANHLDNLSFTPRFRKGFLKLQAMRLITYSFFFLWKLIYQPHRVIRAIDRIRRLNFETKAEMAFGRILFYRWPTLLKHPAHLDTAVKNFVRATELQP